MVVKKSQKKGTIESALRQVGKSNIFLDLRFSAKKPGKRISKKGNVYYEYRSNRSDKNPKKRL